MSIAVAARGIMNSPAKLAIAGAGVGVVLGQIGSLTREGETAMPTPGGAVGRIAGNAVQSAIFSGLFGAAFAAMSRGNVVEGAKNGAIFGAVLGASLAGGRVVSDAAAGAIGY